MKTLKKSVSKKWAVVALSVLGLQLAACGDDKSGATADMKELGSVDIEVSDFDVKDHKAIGRLIFTQFDVDGRSDLNIGLVLLGEDLEFQVSEAVDNKIQHQGEGYSGETQILENTESRLHIKGQITETLVAPSTHFTSGSLVRSYEAVVEDSHQVVSVSVKGQVTSVESEVYDVDTAFEFDDQYRSEDWEQRPSVREALATLRQERAQLSDDEVNARLVEIANSADFNEGLRGIRAGGSITVGGKSYSYAKLMKLLIISFTFAWDDPS